MSNSSPSSQPLQQEQTLKSDAVLKVSPSLNQETLNKPDPPPKCETETPNSVGHNLDRECNSLEAEEEGDEAQEQEILAVSSGMSLHLDPPIADPHDSVSDVTITSPSGDPSIRRGSTKRKKGKAKPHVKKQQAIQEKFRTLMEKLNPISFIPPRIPNFVSYEKLLKKLGLWDFVNIDFDRSIKAEMIAQLVASYNPKQRASYVNDCRVMVNRADLARAFKLPLKKERGNVGGVEVDCVWEDLSHDSIGFVVDFMSEWMLLHDDIWVMSSEVMELMTTIKDGHPEKVDWAGLLWLMVEKELKQGAQLKDCYYASHLQHLIKSQHKHLFSAQIIDPQEEEVDAEAKEKEGEEADEENVKVIGAIGSPREEGPTLGGPSTKLTLGHDGEEEKGMKDVEMNDAEKFGDGDDGDEEVGGEEQGQWLLDGKNDEGEHFMQPCGVSNEEEFGTFEDKKDENEEMDGEEEGEEEREEDEEETGNDFHIFPNDDALEEDTFTGNLLQGMGANPSSMDARADFFNNSGKRVIDHDNHITLHSLSDNNKRLRIHDSWDDKPMDFETCLSQIQQMTEKARMLHAEKEHALMQTNMNQQLLLNELQKRDDVIEHLHKARMEETQKRDREIYRLERELNLMGDVLDGYRKTLKDVQKAFTEYKEKAKLHEEPTYKDAGAGGLMLTGPELERRREEYRMNCILIEHKVKEVGEDLAFRFDGCIDKINFLDKRLAGLEADAKELFELSASRKTQEIEENSADGNVVEVSRCQPSPKPEEEERKLPDVEESPVNE